MVIYSRIEGKLRKHVESLGDVKWAINSDINMRNSYLTLINMFGELLLPKEKSFLLKVMTRNSCFSEDLISNGEKPPITIYGFNEKSRSSSAVCVYPFKPKLETYYHEGVHFLEHYGPENKRLIEKDIPLANIIDI